jgi:uncharacterized protein DUF5309
MAGTVVQGNVSTEEVTPDERAPDVDTKMRRLKPDDAQLTTMTTRTPSRTAIREKVTWFEEEDFPRIVSLSAAAAQGATSLVLVAGQGLIIRPNDVLRNMRTNEAWKVTAVTTDTLTVVHIGAQAALASNAGDALLVIGDAQPQGSDFPVARYLARVLGFNYTQIMRTPWSFTGTATAIELYGGREPAKEAVRKAREHRRKIEASGFFGARSFAAAVAPENEPQGTAGGLVEFVTTFKRDVNGPLTPDFFDTFLMDVMANGSQDKVLFAAPLVVASMSKWNRTGMGNNFAAPEGGSVHGVKVDAFISGAYGYRVPVVVKTEWAEFPTAAKGYGTYAFLVDMTNIERRPLRDRDTKLLTEQQPKGKDTYAAEYLTEMTWEIAQERTHGILYGVT